MWNRIHTTDAQDIVHSRMRTSIKSSQISARSSKQFSSSSEIDDGTARRMVEISLVQLEQTRSAAFMTVFSLPKIKIAVLIRKLRKIAVRIRKLHWIREACFHGLTQDWSATALSSFTLQQWWPSCLFWNGILLGQSHLHITKDSITRFINLPTWGSHTLLNPNYLHRSHPVICDMIFGHQIPSFVIWYFGHDSAHRTEYATHME